MKRKIILIILILGASFLSINIGVETINWSLSDVILIKSRLPRTLSVIISGFGITMAGVIFQHLSRNKFVSPSTSGTVSGAQLGVALSMVFFPGNRVPVMMLFAFISSLLTTFLFMYILGRLKLKELIFIPLIGIMLGVIIKGFTTLLAYRFNFLQVLEGWFYGSFSLVIAGRYEMLYISIPAIIIAFIYAKAFSIAGLGKDFSINLGLNYTFIINVGLIIISVVNASIVIVVGSIPFLGLIIPNLGSIYLGDNLEKNLLTLGLSGSLFLLICDILARVIRFPYEIPVGLIVGFIGCLVFIYLLIRGEKS